MNHASNAATGRSLAGPHTGHGPDSLAGEVPVVKRQMEFLQANIEQALGLVTDLTMQLNGVLREDTPSPVTAEKNLVHTPSSPLGRALFDMNRMVERLHEDVHNIRRRLEV